MAFLFAGEVNRLLEERQHQDTVRLRFWFEAAETASEASKKAREIQLRSDIALEVRRRAGAWANAPADNEEHAIRRISGTHEILFSRLLLSDVQALGLAHYLFQKDVVRTKAEEFARSHGLPMENRENRTAIEDAAVIEIEESISRLLGSAHFAEYRKFEDSLGWRLRLRPFADRLAGVDEPLREDQTESLLEVLASVELAGDEGSDLALVPDVVIEEAATVLSARQLQVLKLLQAEQRWTRTISAVEQKDLRPASPGRGNGSG